MMEASTEEEALLTTQVSEFLEKVVAIYTLKYVLYPIIVHGVATNLLALRVLLKKELRATPSFWFLSLTCVADLTLLCTSMFGHVSEALDEDMWGHGVFSATVCPVYRYVSGVAGTLRAFTAAFLAIERTVAVTFPFSHSRIFKRRAYIVSIAVIVVSSFFLNLLLLIGFRLGGGNCASLPHYPAFLTKLTMVLVGLTGSFIPQPVVAVANAITVYKLRKQSKRIGNMANMPEVFKKRGVRITRTILISNICYFCMDFPFYVTLNFYQPSMALPDSSHYKAVLKLIQSLLTTTKSLNHSIGFCLYITFNTEFRRCFLNSCSICRMSANAVEDTMTANDSASVRRGQSTSTKPLS